MDSQRFEYLMNGYFDGELSSAECEELGALVISDAAARDAYWKFAQAHADLRLWGEQQAGKRQAEQQARAWQIEAAFQPGCLPTIQQPSLQQTSLSSVLCTHLSHWRLSTVAAAMVAFGTLACVDFLRAGHSSAELPQAVASGSQGTVPIFVSAKMGLSPLPMRVVRSCGVASQPSGFLFGPRAERKDARLQTNEPADGNKLADGKEKRMGAKSGSRI